MHPILRALLVGVIAWLAAVGVVILAGGAGTVELAAVTILAVIAAAATLVRGLRSGRLQIDP